MRGGKALIHLTALLAAACVATSPSHVQASKLKFAAHFDPLPASLPSGILRVITSTSHTAEGDMTYYPHEGYDVYDGQGALVRHVENHRSNIDESVTDVQLAPGVYYVAIPNAREPCTWIAVRVDVGRITEANVAERRGA